MDLLDAGVNGYDYTADKEYGHKPFYTGPAIEDIKRNKKDQQGGEYLSECGKPADKEGGIGIEQFDRHEPIHDQEHDDHLGLCEFVDAFPEIGLSDEEAEEGDIDQDVLKNANLQIVVKEHPVEIANKKGIKDIDIETRLGIQQTDQHDGQTQDHPSDAQTDQGFFGHEITDARGKQKKKRVSEPIIQFLIKECLFSKLFDPCSQSVFGRYFVPLDHAELKE
jgi:hypothetical protein